MQGRKRYLYHLYSRRYKILLLAAIISGGSMALVYLRTNDNPKHITEVRMLFKPSIRVNKKMKWKGKTYILPSNALQRISDKRRIKLANSIVARYTGNIFIQEYLTSEMHYNGETDLVFNHIIKSFPKGDKRFKIKLKKASPLTKLDIELLDKIGKMLIGDRRKKSVFNVLNDGRIISFRISLPDPTLTKLVAETLSAKIIESYNKNSEESRYREYVNKLEELNQKFKDLLIPLGEVMDKRRNLVHHEHRLAFRYQLRKSQEIYMELIMYEELVAYYRTLVFSPSAIALTRENDFVSVATLEKNQHLRTIMIGGLTFLISVIFHSGQTIFLFWYNKNFLESTV